MQKNLIEIKFYSLYKAAGISSFEALKSVKQSFPGLKVGHMGTLDPLAEGVLPVAVGKATKLIRFVRLEPKIYECEIYFGRSSKTLDREGIDLSCLPYRKVDFDEEELINAIKGFEGGYSQVPPMYSAVKIGGKRAYKIAEAGEREFKLKPKKVSIFNVDLLTFSKCTARIRLSVGSGFYVRSFARDLAGELNEEAFLLSLVRESVGNFTLANAVYYDFFKRDQCISIDAVVDDYPEIYLSADEYRSARRGGKIYRDVKVNDYAMAYFDGMLVSVLKKGSMPNELCVETNLI